MATLATVVGRDIAPILKLVVPHWWMARFDEASEVAGAATTGFKEAFPEGKSTNALLFTQVEVGYDIIEYHL